MSAVPARSFFLTTTAVVALAVTGPPAGADTVVLKNGQRLEGDAVEVNGQVSIRSALGTLGLPADLVLRIERGASVEQEALERLKSLRPGDIDGRVEVALELEDAGARTLSRRILLDVLEVDSDHAAARGALGYVRCDDQWLTDEDCHRRRGEVLYDGRWVSADERAALEALAHERRRGDLERLRAEIQVEAALLQADREAAASSYYGAGGGDPYGYYPYDPYSFGGVPYWPWYGGGGAYPPGVPPGGRVDHHGGGDRVRPAGGVPGAVAPGAARVPLHHRAGAPPQPLAPQSTHASRAPAPSSAAARASRAP